MAKLTIFLCAVLAIAVVSIEATVFSDDERHPAPALLAREDVKAASAGPNQVVRQEYRWPAASSPNTRPIGRITWTAGAGKGRILEGGVGHNHVRIVFSSRPGAGINTTVRIWAKQQS